jgi:hypothetical protein
MSCPDQELCKAGAQCAGRCRPQSTQLVSTIDTALRRLAHKHWAQVAAIMSEQGFAPEKGGVLVVPQALEKDQPGHRPEWVTFSAVAEKPMMINPRKQGLVL